MREAASELNCIPDWKAAVFILIEPSIRSAPLQKKQEEFNKLHNGNQGSGGTRIYYWIYFSTKSNKHVKEKNCPTPRVPPMLGLVL